MSGDRASVLVLVSRLLFVYCPSFLMEAIQQLTNFLNVFLNFFNSVNMLFCQIRWLEQNFLNSNNSLMIAVFVIILFCIYLIFGGFNSGIISTLGPFFILFAVFFFLLFRRFQRLRGGANGERGRSFEDVFFGSSHQPPPNQGREVGGGEEKENVERSPAVVRAYEIVDTRDDDEEGSGGGRMGDGRFRIPTGGGGAKK